MDNSTTTPTPVKVTLRPHGPVVIAGTITLTDEDGVETTREGSLSLCRCRLSQKLPYCDGSHKVLG